MSFLSDDFSLEVYKHIYPKEPAKFTAKDLEKLLEYCVSIGVSDITIKTQEQIFAEIHGRFYRITKRRLTNAELNEMISTLYKGDGAIGLLNSGEDVDCSFETKPDRFTRLRFRVNVTSILVYGNKGYEITIRTIETTPRKLETFNVPKEIVDNIALKQGLILICGATGSGKSTLMASILDKIGSDPNGHRKIITYESPIEYVYDDVENMTTPMSQSEIPSSLPNFERGLRNALRRKPGIIVVGEMRDKETISEGITASMTGHLVYGTLHTNGVADSIRRMVNSFSVEEKNSRAADIVSSIEMIVAQQLLPSTDGKRVALREYLIFNEDIKDFLLEGGVDNLTYNTKKMLKEHGQSFYMDAKKYFDSGLITEEQFKPYQRRESAFNKDLGASGGAEKGVSSLSEEVLESLKSSMKNEILSTVYGAILQENNLLFERLAKKMVVEMKNGLYDIVSGNVGNVEDVDKVGKIEVKDEWEGL